MAHAFSDDKSKVDIETVFNDLQTNLQSNVNTLYNTCVTNGVTPTAKTPAAINTAINGISEITWSETIDVPSQMMPFYVSLPYKNIKSIRVNSVSGDCYINGVEYDNGGIISPFNANQFIVELRTPSGASVNEYWLNITVTYQTKVLR